MPAAAAEAPVWRGPRSSLRALVGRDVELAELRRALREHDLVTATGPGGCGKTALALAAATGSRVPVTVLGPASLNSTDQLVPALAATLQVPVGHFVGTLPALRGPGRAGAPRVRDAGQATVMRFSGGRGRPAAG